MQQQQKDAEQLRSQKQEQANKREAAESVKRQRQERQ